MVECGGFSSKPCLNWDDNRQRPLFGGLKPLLGAILGDSFYFCGVLWGLCVPKMVIEHGNFA